MMTSSLSSKITAGVVAVLTGAFIASLPSWPAIADQHRRATEPVPTGRRWAGFGYDVARGELVLFGGDDLGRVFGDTWIRRHGSWTKQNPAHSPSPRTGVAMVYDAATKQLLVFGGSTGLESGFQSDTWLWTGTTWQKLHPAASPPARHNADLIYDAASHDVILFGGYDGSYLGDTWSWNGTTWTKLSPAKSPSPRDSESLAYDQATRQAILFGGVSTSTGRLGDTWSWNGTTWTRLSPSASPGVVTVAWQAAYDAATRQILLFSGDPGGGPFASTTWVWTGANWVKLTPARPPLGRGYGSMAYDSADHRVFLFGGYTNDREIFFPSIMPRWDGTAWHRAS